MVQALRELQKYEAALSSQFLTDALGKQVVNHKVGRLVWVPGACRGCRGCRRCRGCRTGNGVAAGVIRGVQV